MLEAARSGRQFGKYLLVRQLATGGMAEVYLARQTGPGGFEKQCVIKRMLPQLAVDKQFVQMFLDEARIAAHLAHPNIVQIFDFGQVGADYFIAMEYVRGVDLNQLLAASGGRVPPAIALRLIGAVAEGLDHAHRATDSRGQPLGLVHRDVTPSNVIVSYDGVAKILDFGIAKASARVSRTEVGVIKGKLPYMSPEQVGGEPLDGRSDIFSLGTMLYELTVGEKPFDGTNPAEISLKILHDDPRPPEVVVDGFPAELSALILRALAKRPIDRFASARDLHLAIEETQARLGARATSHDVAAFVSSAIPPRPDEEASGAGPETPEATDPTVAMSRQALASDPGRRTPVSGAPAATGPSGANGASGAAPVGGDEEPPQPIVGDLGVPVGVPDVRRNLGGGGGGTKYIILLLVIAVAVGFWYLKSHMDKPEPTATPRTAPTPTPSPTTMPDTKGDAPKTEGPKPEPPKPGPTDAPKGEPKVEPLEPQPAHETSKAEAPKAEPARPAATKPPKTHRSSKSRSSEPKGLPRLPAPPPTDD
jgi:serine/threonine-protein kinase